MWHARMEYVFHALKTKWNAAECSGISAAQAGAFPLRPAQLALLIMKSTVAFTSSSFKPALPPFGGIILKPLIALA